MLSEAVDAGVQIFTFSVGPHEGLWLPSGFLKCERTGPEESMGVRMTTFLAEEIGMLPELPRRPK